MVGTESFDMCAMLCLSPGCKGFVGLKSLIFGAKYLKSGEIDMIVSKGDIILMFSKTKSG